MPIENNVLVHHKIKWPIVADDTYDHELLLNRIYNFSHLRLIKERTIKDDINHVDTTDNVLVNKDKNNRQKRDATSSKWPLLINSVVTALPIGNLYLTNDQKLIKVDLQTTYLLDKIRYVDGAINGLRTISASGHLNIQHISAQGPYLYIITNDLTIGDCNLYCESTGTKVSDLDSLLKYKMYTTKSINPIVLADTIYNTLSTTHCTGTNYKDSDENYFTYYASRAAILHKYFYITFADMIKELNQMKVAHIAINQTHIYFTNNLVGHCACTGDIQNNTQNDINTQ